MNSGIQVGHVHLKVSDLEGSIAFYQTALGMNLMQRYGTQAAFMSFDGYHHHLGLNTWLSKAGPRPAPNTTGLFHVAFLYPTQKALAQAVQKLFDNGIRLTGASDHGVSIAVYLNDPDGNGIELYWDRDEKDWPRDSDGNLMMVTDSLDVQKLLSLA